MALGSAGVAHNTDIDIPSEVSFLCCDFGNSAKQHQEHSTFDLIIPWRKEIVYKYDKMQKKKWTSFTIGNCQFKGDQQMDDGTWDVLTLKSQPAN